MSRLTFAALTSLDGAMADRDGRFDWAEPDAEEHGFVDEVHLFVAPVIVGGASARCRRRFGSTSS